MTFEKVMEAHLELENINDKIISVQAEHIKKLEAYVIELQGIINKYLLKNESPLSS